MQFSELKLSDSILNILVEQNCLEPYPIQEVSIPAILIKKDVLGIAPTGSGKTIGYALPILMNLQKSAVLKNRHVNVLILVPTRELAIQVHEVFSIYGKGMMNSVKSFAVFGGVSINPQMIGLQNVNILIATPGRLIELVESNAVHLSDIETLVLDEADKMLDLGFKVEMDKIISWLPKMRQNLLFSATLNEDINAIHQILLHNPVVIKIEREEENIDLIQQTAYFIDEERKGPLLRFLIKKADLKQILVFTSSTYKADHVADKLRKNGVDAQAIHSKKSQGARTEALRNFKEGRIQVLVATDLISRGIDIKFLPFVINYELPRSPKDYIHRIGRTGRAETSGEAISLISLDEQHHFKIIQKKMKKKVELLDGEEMMSVK
jgi:ATP-dependent RNA helicase RhlE